MDLESISQKMLRCLKGLFDDPIRNFNALKALLRGSYYIIKYKISMQNVIIRFPFLAFCKVVIKGPGKVFIDRDCAAFANLLDVLTITTASRNAEVSIGRNCALGGTIIRCLDKVVVGCDFISANALIQDSLFFFPEEIKSEIEDKTILAPKPINIGNNVWLGGRSFVLRGCIIERDSVAATGSLCYDLLVKSYSLVSGNPVLRPLPIQSLKEWARNT